MDRVTFFAQDVPRLVEQFSGALVHRLHLKSNCTLLTIRVYLSRPGSRGENGCSILAHDCTMLLPTGQVFGRTSFSPKPPERRVR